MHLSIVLMLFGSWTVSGQSVNFTINSIGLLAIPSATLSKGQQLKLRCNVDIAKTTEFELNSTFYFYREDTLIYNVTTSDPRAIYEIPKVKVSDTNSYKCRVVAQGKEKKSEEVSIKVTGVTVPSLTVSKIEVAEGDEVTVRCEVLDEEPPMIFTFYKITTKEEKVKNTNTNYAEVKFEIKEGEKILQFECKVKLIFRDDTPSPSSKRQTVTVRQRFGTPTIDVKPSNNFTEGTDMEVTCSVQQSTIRPEKVDLTLQKESHILKSSTSGSLTFSKMATVEDMGNYTCKAEGSKASKSTSIMVKVKELFPKPRLQLLTMGDISEGDIASLQCSVFNLSSRDAALQDFYFRGYKQIKKSKGGNLHLKMFSSDSGEYTCEVTIANITKISNPVKVVVYAPVSKPILQHRVRGNKMVVLGDTLMLTCQSQSGTPPIKYTLYRGNDLLEIKDVNNYKEATFIVNVTKPDDLGQYRCHARNRNRNLMLYSDFVNVTVITPVANVSLIVIPASGEVEEGAELSLICKAKNGTLPISFSFFVKRGTEILLYNMTKTDQMFAQYQVTSFAKEKDGAYYCVASNMANKSMKSPSREVKAVLASWKKGVIGAIVFIIILAAIGIAVYLYLDKKKKKGTNISGDSSRNAKSSHSSNEKHGVEMKSDDAYFGSIHNEEELHILRTEENIGNNQQNHDAEYTEADGSAADPHQDARENNISRADDNSEINNHT